MYLQIHIVLGIGDLREGKMLQPNQTGVMADVSASANDPIFINHHTFVDCIFEEWLKRYPNSNYPTESGIPQGHQANNYIVPFFPLYTHQDMFKRSDNFGYSCSSLTNINPTNSGSGNSNNYNMAMKHVMPWLLILLYALTFLPF